jgi:hypothetical protein
MENKRAARWPPFFFALISRRLRGDIMRLFSFIFVLLIASLATPVLAQTAAERAACEADAKKFCPGVRPIGGKLLECMSKEKAKLTEACRKVIESRGG